MKFIVIASYFLNIPIAHIHGGESTHASIDEGIRHSITKMSWLHFVATNKYKKRIIQLGENPSKVHNVGSLGVENIKKITLIKKNKLEKLLNIKLNKKNLLITYHPETLNKIKSIDSIREILKSLENLQNTFLIFTAPNADSGNYAIKKEIKKFVKKNINKSAFFDSLGTTNYLSLLKLVNGIVGNSSSGIIEAPSLKVGTINIGDRQKGREMSNSIINCKPIKKEVDKALKLLFSQKFNTKLKKSFNKYEKNDTSISILQKISKNKIPENLYKVFKDI